MLRAFPCCVLAVAFSACIDIGDLVFEPPGGGGAGAGPGNGGDGGGGGSTGSSYYDVVMADAPLGYWRLDAATGVDSTPNETEAELDAFIGTTAGETVQFGVAGAIVDDANGAVTVANGAELYVDWMHPFGFPADASSTLELWVKEPAGSPHTLDYQMADGRGYFVKFNAESAEYYRYDGMLQTHGASGFAAIDYQHFVVTFDGTTSRALLFHNGTPTQTPGLVMDKHWATALSAPFKLVATNMGGSVTVDEIAVYDYVLPADRVKKHYDCGKSGVCD